MLPWFYMLLFALLQSKIILIKFMKPYKRYKLQIRILKWIWNLYAAHDLLKQSSPLINGDEKEEFKDGLIIEWFLLKIEEH